MGDTGWIDRLLEARFLDVRWDPADKPVLVANGRSYPIATLAEPVATDLAYVVGIRDRELLTLARWLRASAVHFYEMRVTDLAPLAGIDGLAHLAIEWNTKVHDLSPIGAFTALETLVLLATPKVRSLVPLETLARLRAFECSGGIWTRNDVDSLEPLSGLPLEDVRLTHLHVAVEGLRPLAQVKTLRRLRLSNQFPTEDYAYLSVHLPDAACDRFAPFMPLDPPLDGKDVMVTGSRKPFLSSQADRAQLRRYVDAFEALRRQYAAAATRP
jgi:hypothetical protein